MSNLNSLEKLKRLRRQIDELTSQLSKDTVDGFLLRPQVRERLEDYLETLEDEYYNEMTYYEKNN